MFYDAMQFCRLHALSLSEGKKKEERKEKCQVLQKDVDRFAE